MTKMTKREFYLSLKKDGYFMTTNKLAELVKIDRLALVVVRCGCGRFICPAQDVNHFINIITKEGSEYVRDVSVWKTELDACGVN